MQDGTPRADTEERSAASILVLQKEQGTGRDCPAKSPGDTPVPRGWAASAQPLSSQGTAAPWPHCPTGAGSELPGLAEALPAPCTRVQAAGGLKAELG